MRLKVAFSNSHQIAVNQFNIAEEVKFNLSLDKLTLVFNPMSHGGGEHPTHEDIIKLFIGLVSDASTKSSLGITRSYSRGSGGYAVSIAGKVPTSQDPLIWSKKAGYFLQIGAKDPNAAFFRLDINPIALNPMALAHMQELFEHHFHIGWTTLKTALVTRCDAALDIEGISMNDWVRDIPQRKKRQSFVNLGKFETLYIGSKQGSPLVIYNKARQLGLPADQHRTRGEFRCCTRHSLSEVAGLKCPFKKLEILDPIKLPGSSHLQKKAWLRVGQALGKQGILDTHPVSAHENLLAALAATKPGWWKPNVAWSTWSNILADSFPGIFS